MKMRLIETNAKLTKKEILILTQAESVRLDDVITPEKPLVLSPVEYYVFEIEGDGGEIYTKYFVRDEDGTLYSTSGKVFGETVSSCFATLTENGETESFKIEVSKAPSANYRGKFYIKARLVG